MTMTDNDMRSRRWSFPVSVEDRQVPEVAEKIAFLEGAHAKGFEA